MSFTDWQEAVVIVFSNAILELGNLLIAICVLIAATMPLYTVVRLLYRRWRPR